MTDISVIVLTKDEELHIGRCLERLMPLEPRQVFVVDCFSKDRTVEIAEGFKDKYAAWGGEVNIVKHEWPGIHSKQLNWAFDTLEWKSTWVLRMDADEYLYPEAVEEIKSLIGGGVDDEVTSMSLWLRRVFMGRKIRFGGISKIPLVRIFRYGVGRIEDRAMDEHVVTSRGRCVQLKGEFADDNLNGLDWWTRKHLGYAKREAADAMAGEKYKPSKGFYYRAPIFWRAFGYFLYRYVVRLGFLDGKEGFLWNFLQAWWYRTMVDAEIWQMQRGGEKDDA